MKITVDVELTDEQEFIVKNLHDKFLTVRPWGDDVSLGLEELGIVSLDLERGEGWLTDVGRQVRKKLVEQAFVEDTVAAGRHVVNKLANERTIAEGLEEIKRQKDAGPSVPMFVSRADIL